jgi:hypothetical protein
MPIIGSDKTQNRGGFRNLENKNRGEFRNLENKIAGNFDFIVKIFAYVAEN